MAALILFSPSTIGGKLGLIVYTADGTGYKNTWNSSNMGQGPGALAWLTGDVNGDGRTDIIQPFNNRGKLGLIVYTADGTGYKNTWNSSNMGQGSGAVAWLTGDMDSDHRVDLMQVWKFHPNDQPVANAGGPYAGKVGSSITFSASASFDPDGSIVEYSWQFSDGRRSEGKDVQHTFSQAGTYTATLTVQDNDGAVSSSAASVSITTSTTTPKPVNLTIDLGFGAVSNPPYQCMGKGTATIRDAAGGFKSQGYGFSGYSGSEAPACNTSIPFTNLAKGEATITITSEQGTSFYCTKSLGEGFNIIDIRFEFGGICGN